ncbi:MAG TPA: endonuclease III [Verrucomicrobiae bacterium]|nr:endonuclease III [Verrucomicrobiae bacterium]
MKATGANPHGNHDDPLDELIYILLSAQTEAYLYRETFASLKARFTPWSRLLDASEDEIAKVIARGGLAKKKAAQIRGVLQKLMQDRGELSLTFLAGLPDDDALAYLVCLPGIGPKSAKCILMYSLKRAVFPVDTHVWRVLRRIGLAPPVAKPSDRMEADLEKSIPRTFRHDLHVKLVTHGRETCHAHYPRCQMCVVANLCRSKGKVDDVWHSFSAPKGVWAHSGQRTA